MTNYREILRLGSLGIQKQDIAAACGCSRNTVTSVLKKAQEKGVFWEAVQDTTNPELSDKLFPGSTALPEYKAPDCQYIHREMAKSGVTLSLLWAEYNDQCRAQGEVPYQITQFKKYYADYVQKNKSNHAY